MSTGKESADGIPPKARSGQARAEFLRLISIETDECVLWPFSTFRDGYGQVWFGPGRTQRAHRLALELRKGPPTSPGMDAAHAPVVCHTRLCINYRHLRWASRSENMADALYDGTHRRGERNASCKLTEDEVRAIRASPSSETKIGAEYGISAAMVGLIRRRKRWAWLQ